MLYEVITGTTVLGVEGIAKGDVAEGDPAAGGREDLDFSLNMSPVRGRRSDRHDGIVLTRITSYNVCYTKLLRCLRPA